MPSVDNLSYEQEFKEYVQKLETEMQIDMIIDHGGEGQLDESHRDALNKRKLRHQSNRPKLFENHGN